MLFRRRPIDTQVRLICGIAASGARLFDNMMMCVVGIVSIEIIISSFSRISKFYLHPPPLSLRSERTLLPIYIGRILSCISYTMVIGMILFFEIFVIISTNQLTLRSRINSNCDTYVTRTIFKILSWLYLCYFAMVQECQRFE